MFCTPRRHPSIVTISVFCLTPFAWLGFGSGAAQGHHADSHARPDALRNADFEQRLDAQIPTGLVFRNAAGNQVTLDQYLGQNPIILTLAYYECPMLCPLALEGLVKNLRPLALYPGREFGIVTVSIDPEETPAQAAKAKNEYIRRYSRPGAAEGWHFLTGPAQSIEALADAVGFRYAYDPSRDEYAHPAGIVLLTSSGRISRYFYGLDYSARDLRLGLLEASAGKIGSPIDRLLLFCYHYDPEDGRYSLAIMNVLRLAGMATVAVLGLFMGVMFRRERQGTGRTGRGSTLPKGA